MAMERGNAGWLVTLAAGAALVSVGCGSNETTDRPLDSTSVKQATLVSAQSGSPPASRLDINPPASTPSVPLAKNGVSNATYTQAALAFATQNASRYGLTAGAPGLSVLSVKRSLLGVHVTLQETVNGIPVAESTFSVSFDNGSGEVYRVHSAIIPHQPAAASKSSITEDEAYDAAWRHLGVSGELTALPRAILTYVSDGSGSGQLLLVYRVDLHVSAPAGAWQVDVDAGSGAILAVRDTALPRYKKAGTAAPAIGSSNGPLADRGAAFAKLQAAEAEKADGVAALASTVNGTGQVFDPDPMTTLHSTTLSDTSPASSFQSAYLTVNLLDITLNNGVYSLQGPWARIVDFEAPNTAPSTTTNGTWTAQRGNNAFNDAMTYFHIDRNQRYIQSLGFTGIQNVPIELDSDGFSGADNSHYIPLTNRISFGHGGVDDNEDADVLRHEYNHAIDHAINSSFSGGDTGAMGEGFGDYWAASESVDVPSWDNAKVFTWDANAVDNYWPGRRLDRTNLIYDPSQTYGAHQSIPGGQTDELWSTPLYQGLVALRQAGVSKAQVDTILLEARFGLGAGITMRQMATAIVDTAKKLYPLGPHAGILSEKFLAQNILLASDWGLFTALFTVIN